jgi:hypothetical protein
MIYEIQTRTEDGYKITKVTAENEAQAEAIFMAKHPDATITGVMTDSEQFIFDVPASDTLTIEDLGLGYWHNGRFYSANDYDLVAL